jgi:hypothetical protein
MAERNTPDLSHLRGAEIEKIAKALVAGTVSTVLDNKEALIGLKAEELKKLTDIRAHVPVADCGGIGCG